MRPYVPKPTDNKKRPVQMEVITRLMGKKASLTPGTMNGEAETTAAEADAAALGSELVGPVAT